MNCDQARELIGADPDNDSPELLAHLQDCPACKAHRDQVRAFNARIFKALKFDWNKVPAQAGTATASLIAPSAGVATSSGIESTSSAAPTSGIPSTVSASGGASTSGAISAGPEASNVTPFRNPERAPVPRHKRPGLFAFSASLAAALVAGFVLWLSRPADSLAAEVVTHVEGEPQSWDRTGSVSREDIEAVLRKSGVRLGPGMHPIVYASACWFRGHYVPHLVVMTPSGPVTIMILLNETVASQQQFSEAGFSGLLVPAPAGSVAVLSRKPMELDGPAREVVEALRARH